MRIIPRSFAVQVKSDCYFALDCYRFSAINTLKTSFEDICSDLFHSPLPTVLASKNIKNATHLFHFTIFRVTLFPQCLHLNFLFTDVSVIFVSTHIMLKDSHTVHHSVLTLIFFLLVISPIPKFLIIHLSQNIPILPL